ncbi:hypothetical protein [Endozoicomonas sp. SESOKO1]|uniref:hypothetical protein n=1 Tax=Endozoicomonas sp. SESOKO1 TaxID=2828742 RepID=UPI002147C538|nr:hypothetical protein [Endozoicomonas sp. SESOKO1]
MKTNRYVPFIMGVGGILAAIWALTTLSGIWGYVVGVPLLMFGWPSLKTAIFASDREVAELTGKQPMSAETKRKFEDRL